MTDCEQLKIDDSPLVTITLRLVEEILHCEQLSSSQSHEWVLRVLDTHDWLIYNLEKDWNEFKESLS